MTTDFEHFDPEQVQVSNTKLTAGQLALFIQAKNDYNALLQLVVERTELTSEQVLALPLDDRFTRLVQRISDEANAAIGLAALEIAPAVPEPAVSQLEQAPAAQESVVDWMKRVELAKARTSPAQPRHDIIAVTAALLLVAVLAISVSNAIRQQHWITLAVTVAAIVLLLYMAARKPKR